MPVRKAFSSPIKKFRASFPSVSAPVGGLPYMNPKVSLITSEQLGDMLSRYSAWREYCEDQHLMALAAFMEIKDAYDIKVAEKMVLSNEAKITDKRNAALIDPEVLTLGTTYLEKETYLKMLSSKLESFSNSLATLSRELTRRGITNF